MFREAVHQIIDAKLKLKTDPVQGYIPSEASTDGTKAIDEKNHICTVRIPNPHGGLNPADTTNQGYIELKGVPLPWYQQGIIGDLLALLNGGDRGVLVGFKGGNMAFPYIISPLPGFPGQDRKSRTVDNRTPVSVSRSTNIGGSHQLVSPDPTVPPVASVRTFDELFAPNSPPTPPEIDVNKLSIFNSNQSTNTNIINNNVFRDFLPTVITPK